MEHAVEMPKLSSLILKHDLDAPLAGLDTIAPENRPPVEVVFWSFRVMVGLGTLMLLLGVASLLARASRQAVRMALAASFRVVHGAFRLRRGHRRLDHHRGGASALHRSTVCCAPRTPFRRWPRPRSATSLIAFVIVYFAVFGMGTWYLLRLMSRAPQPHEPDPPNAPAHAAGITPGPALAAATPEGASWLTALCSPTSGPRSSRSPYSCTSSWTASISASASCFRFSAWAGNATPR